MAGKGKASKILAPVSTGKYPYPSLYGSHRSMVVKENEDGTVVCKDDYGEYETTTDRLDSGLADPRRYAVTRLQKLYQGKKEEVKDKR